MNKQDKIQEEIVDKTLKFFKTERFGYINGAPRIGKMKITIDFLKQYNGVFGEILLCYPENKIKEGWENDFKKWGYDNKYVTFVNFSSLKKYKDYMFDLLVIDEFHNCSPLERDYCQQIMTNAPKTLCLALSGTVSKDTHSEWGLKEIAKYTTEEGISDGILSDYHITIHLVDLDNKIKTPNKKGKLLTEKQKYDNLGYVIRQMKQDGRNSMHLALSRNRLSLSSIGKLEYLNKLLKELKGRYIVFTGLSSVADSIGIPSFHSKSENDDNLQKFQRKEINHLALVEKGKTGLTYQDLDGVVLLNFTYNMENSAQGVSRAGLLDYVGKCSDIHIIALNEEPEIKKLKESLSMLDKTKVKYI